MATSNEREDNQVATLHQYPVITPCDLCDTKEDVHSFCRNCSQNLCDGCKRTHLKCTVTRDHNVVHISEGKSSDSEATACTKHGERLFFYCRTCSVLFCPKCLNPTHKSHDVLDTDEYAKELQNNVALMIEEKSTKVEGSKRNVEHIEVLKKKYVDQCTKSKTSVMDAAKILHSEVDRVQAELLSTISNHESQGLSKFDEAKRQEMKTGEELQESLDKLIRHSKKHDNISLVAYASELSVDDRHKTELDSEANIPSFSVPTVHFRAAKLSKTTITELFGTLHNSHADIPRVIESTKKMPESKSEQQDFPDAKKPQNVPGRNRSKQRKFCTCLYPADSVWISSIGPICAYCDRVIKR